VANDVEHKEIGLGFLFVGVLAYYVVVRIDRRFRRWLLAQVIPSQLSCESRKVHTSDKTLAACGEGGVPDLDTHSETKSVRIRTGEEDPDGIHFFWRGIMRALILGSLLVILTGPLGGCSSDTGAKTATPVAAQADKPAEGKTWVMQSGGADVLKLTAPAGVKCRSGDGSLHFIAPQQYEVEFWVVPGAKTVDEAVGRVSSQIVSDFKDFKPKQNTDLTVAGSPAKRLVGKGHEADDGDPGEADVIVFKVGDHVFIACNHGESLDPKGQEGMVAMVNTAQAP
jgi:hypothetical protein